MRNSLGDFFYIKHRKFPILGEVFQVTYGYKVMVFWLLILFHFIG